MCCRVRCYPLEESLAALVLGIGQFEPNGNGLWVRNVGPGYVSGKYGHDYLELNLYPVVNDLQSHRYHRDTASIMFEIGWRYLEKVGGIMEQHATVGSCLQERPSIAKIAEYPGMPLRWENVCPGFREVFNANEERPE